MALQRFALLEGPGADQVQRHEEHEKGAIQNDHGESPVAADDPVDGVADQREARNFLHLSRRQLEILGQQVHLLLDKVLVLCATRRVAIKVPTCAKLVESRGLLEIVDLQGGPDSIEAKVPHGPFLRLAAGSNFTALISASLPSEEGANPHVASRRRFFRVGEVVPPSVAFVSRGILASGSAAEISHVHRSLDDLHLLLEKRASSERVRISCIRVQEREKLSFNGRRIRGGG
mmetsp:Transcript_9191/g.34568  ORF Transcript_9191/g.34568 Transcript_9191/m.34568 type:complete len:232 (-) Transcript_9191:814-1509(-)